MEVPHAPQLDERSPYSAFVRALNDEIVALSAREQEGALQILCECSRRDCATAMDIAVEEYRSIRGDDNRYLMAPGHEAVASERVVSRHGLIVVVEPCEHAVAARRWRPLVLVVEHEVETRELCLTCLQETGAVALAAVDGQQGLQEARALRPDLIVTDVSMPVLDGFRLAQALDLYDRTQDIPVIFLLEQADHEHAATGHKLGAAACITKPFDPAVFTSVVAGVLAATA
jgi:CheY-like chemotaxis protein